MYIVHHAHKYISIVTYSKFLGIRKYEAFLCTPSRTGSAQPAPAPPLFPPSPFPLSRMGLPNQAAAQQRAAAIFPSLLSPTRGAQPSASSSPGSH